MKTTLHVGLAPFMASNGEKIGSFQALNESGHSIATVTFCDENMVQFFCVESINRADFLKGARALFDELTPTNFNA